MSETAAQGVSPVLLRLAGITKRFGGLLANAAIDLDLRAGEILALLGENGAGKTTLTNILFGHYTADAGEVSVADAGGRLVPLPPGSPRAALAAGVGMVHQHFALADNLTALDNVVLGTEPLWGWRQRRRAARERLDALCRDSGLAVSLDAPVLALSVGERQRLEILKARYRDVRVLVLDEPTAVLTPQDAEQLFATLRRLAARGMGVVFISHKLGEIMALCDRVAVLRGGRKVLEVPVDDTSRAELAEAMVGRAVAFRRREELAPGAPVLELDRVTVAPGGAHGRTGLVDAELKVRAYEIVGIAGVSGNGQQALSALLSGMAAPAAGSVRLEGRPWPGARPRAVVAAGVGRVPEDRHAHGVVGDLTIAENLALETYREPGLQRLGVARRAALRAHALRLIGAYDVRCEGPGQPARLLSGGNIQKLVLARVLERDPAFILADQPTRGLDVGAVAYVHGRLLDARRRGAAILLISEDLDELLALADRIAVIHRGRLTEPLPTRALTVRELGLMMAGQGRHAAA